MSAGPTPCSRFAEVASVTVYGEDHVAGVVGENRFVLDGNVIKEFFRLMLCVKSRFRRLGGECTDVAE